MANIQPQFEQFHKNIRTYYEINETLREKKDIIVSRVQAYLKANQLPGCVPFIQGSYKMKVGICALRGAEFDIDVGLRFSFDESRYSPSEVRGWILRAVEGHTQTVKAHANCIRVTYKDGYHVDLVAYAWWDDVYGHEQYRLAHESKGWRPADPPALVEYVRRAGTPFVGTEDGTGTDQFRRVIRYLKRWNDAAILGESPDKPSGLALVLLVERYLKTPAWTWDRTSMYDLDAVRTVARAAARTVGRIMVTKPTPEGEDMFGRLSDPAMNALKQRFNTLAAALDAADAAPDPRAACQVLEKLFRSDFPIPTPAETARKTAGPAIIPTSTSAA